MRRKLLILFFLGIFLSLFGAFLYSVFEEVNTIPREMQIKIRDAESSLNSKIQNLAGYYSKYDKIDVRYYYRYNPCLDVLKSTLEKFDDKVTLNISARKSVLDREIVEEIGSIEEGIALPAAILRGRAQIYDYGDNHIRDQELITVIDGYSACSEKILLNDFCALLKDAPSICEQISADNYNIESQRVMPQDPECYKPCNIKYLSGSTLFNEMWSGPPCERIDFYTPDSKVRIRDCDENSCPTNLNDKACCKVDECVLDGRCIDLGTIRDVDEDSSIEICSMSNGLAKWIDPDSSSMLCHESRFIWFSCDNYEQCEFGINNYKKNDRGLCCGDESGEFATQCRGKICKSGLDYSCCEEDQCVFDGKCYDSGCSSFDLENGTLSAYCDSSTRTWIDLDNDYCALCLGKGASSGTVCCGDDVDEGETPVQFGFGSKNGSDSRTQLWGCIKSGNQCIYPYRNEPFDEGYYLFRDDSVYLQGSYYCDNNLWYSLESVEKYCKKSGFFWDKEDKLCCGDSSSEFWIKGKDGTNACCSSQNDEVLGGECESEKFCGNSIIDPKEACEDPRTANNTYCSQVPILCQDTKTGMRDEYGSCNSNCQCEEDPVRYECQKGICGAGCGKDEECEEGYTCDQSSCSCRIKTYCGDLVVQKLNDNFQREECEPAGSLNSTFCRIEECKDKKSKKAVALFDIATQGYGICKGNCKCDYRGFNYTCQIGKCGASCNEDGSGCEIGYKCNLDTCSCYSEFVCGNGVCEQGEQNSCPNDCTLEQCPVKIDLEMNRAVYYLNDTMEARVSAYDFNNKPLPEIRFSFDLIFNEQLMGSSIYMTDAFGNYNIRKKVSNFAPRGINKYIVKSQILGCPIVSDTEYVSIFVNNPYQILSGTVNYTRLEFIFDPNITKNQVTESKCGDKIIGYGEACEGNGICRPSFGCDYTSKIFDEPESCESCGCPEDIKSKPNDEIYCDSCKHCGDLEVNCGEKCENGTINSGTICRSDRLYQRNDVCRNCNFEDDGIISDLLLDTCECKCPKNPQINCVDGNYINYSSDYVSGCSNGACNACNCADTYTKDSNNDGIEDKCAQEYCGNKIDDNDNSEIDESSCIWYYCSQCGNGLFKSCSRDECGKFEQGCFYFDSYYSLLWMNRTKANCGECSSIRGCEGYKNDILTCETDPCHFGECSFTESQCCVDKDLDKVCDKVDNCLNLTNIDQSDLDNDGFGDLCDQCKFEANLTIAMSVNETQCSDSIDNDCDGAKDCFDSDCVGTGVCCSTVSDCKQNQCTMESCVSGKCIYEKRQVCDATECSKGFCDSEGICRDEENSRSICVNCAKDLTLEDYGIGYNLSLFSKKGCCGNNANEYFAKNVNYSGCCTLPTDCVDNNGMCKPTGSVFSNSYCLKGKVLECNSNFLCSEASVGYNGTYFVSKETGLYCTFDGLKWSFLQKMPKEACFDLIDNDCDKKIDFEDEGC